MNTYHLEITTPEGSRFDGEAGKLVVRTLDGQIAILAGHIPLVTALKPGECRVTLPDESVRKASASGGILTVTKTSDGQTSVHLLSTDFAWDES